MNGANKDTSKEGSEKEDTESVAKEKCQEEAIKCTWEEAAGLGLLGRKR